MLIRLINLTLRESDRFKDENERYNDDMDKKEEYEAFLIINSDASSTLLFFKILEFK